MKWSCIESSPSGLICLFLLLVTLTTARTHPCSNRKNTHTFEKRKKYMYERVTPDEKGKEKNASTKTCRPIARAALGQFRNISMSIIIN